MFLFPLAYILSFLYALWTLAQRNIKGVLAFMVIGLPVYMTALSVTHMYGFSSIIPYMQAFKEMTILLGLAVVLLNIDRKPKLHVVDQLMLVFFGGSLLYLVLPIGTYGFGERLIGFKALSSFVLIYFTGRFCKLEEINIRKLFSAICLVIILAAVVLTVFELVPNEHLQTKTGLMDFSYYFYGVTPSGNYGLTWTFETESGLKRFASIFSNPLELSSSAILALSVLMALSTGNRNQFVYSNFNAIAFLATLCCVVFAVSRASLVNYLILIYCYAWIVNNKKIITFFHYSFLAVVIYLIFFLKGDLFDFIIDTLSFRNASSMGHVLEWLNGINAMISHPFGLGLGSSGRVSGETESNIGGENQLVIIGVQVGVLMLAVYIAAYILFIRAGLQELKTAKGKKKMLITGVVLLKIGLIIPLFTSYLDTFVYLTYTVYFLSGLMINCIMASSKHIKPSVS